MDGRDTFVKSHGLGNDYIVLDQSHLSFPVGPEAVRLICHRHYGIGSDGILLLAGTEGGAFSLRILNPDGSEAEKSGNGLRIFAKALYEHGYTDDATIEVHTPGGTVRCELEIEGDNVKAVAVEMGSATFRSSAIPVDGPDREVVGEEIRVDGELLTLTAVSVGNPHAVFFTDRLDENYLRKVGPLVENHPLFPRRTNVQFARVAAADRVEILIWERGAGYTLASGSSSCAVAAACVRNGLTGRRLTVSMPGGELDVTVREDWTIRMKGPVEEVCTGTLSRDLLERISTLGPGG